jgi:phage tail-like protein
MPVNRDIPLLAAPSASFFDVLLIDSLAGPTSILVGSSTFKKVSGLSHAVDRAAVKEGGRPFAQRSLRAPHASTGEVTLEYGFVHTTSLWNWSRAVDSGVGFRKDVLINQYAFGGGIVPIPMRTYYLIGAWPLAWTASDLSSSASEIAIETLRLAYEELVLPASLVFPGEEPSKATLATETNDISVSFPINPESISLSRNLAGASGGNKEIGASFPAMTLSETAFDTLTLSNLMFDNSEDEQSTTWVWDQVTKLYKMNLNTIVRAVGGTRRPRVRFTWGNLKFFGAVTSFKANWTMFDNAGNPLRAVVDLTLTGQHVGGTLTETLKVASDTTGS